MKKIFLLITMSASLCAVDLKLPHMIYKNDYKVSEETILELLDGSDNEVIEGALMGLYLSLKMNNPEDLNIYYGILEDLLRAIERRNSSYWDGVIPE